MGRLFWKLFLSYWLAAIVLVLVGAWASHQIANLTERPPDDESEVQAHARTAMRLAAMMQVIGHEVRKGNLDRAREQLQQAPRRLLVLDEHGEDLLGREVPRMARAVQRGRVPRRPRAPHWLTQSVRTPDGAKFTMLAPVPPLSAAPDIPKGNGAPAPPRLGPRPLWWVRVGVALVVSAALCYFLARYLAAPVRRVRFATGRVSRGDLSVRIGSALGHRRDEIADLARDFDRMTEQLDRLVRSRERLLQDVAHELRSPLARLQVALELARQRTQGAADAEHDRIELETERLGELIGQILRLESLNQPLTIERMEMIDLGAIVTEVAEDATFEAGPKAIAVVSNLSGLQTAQGDPAELASAIENVVRNAVKWSPKESTVSITSRTAPRGDALVIEVCDEGPGVPDETLAHLFEPFYRVDSARSRAEGGHGLGLAIAERIIRRHAGNIEAANRDDRSGLRVTITIPASFPV